jgi:hypothetical protein
VERREVGEEARDDDDPLEMDVGRLADREGVCLGLGAKDRLT